MAEFSLSRTLAAGTILTVSKCSTAEEAIELMAQGLGGDYSAVLSAPKKRAPRAKKKTEDEEAPATTAAPSAPTVTPVDNAPQELPAGVTGATPPPIPPAGTATPPPPPTPPEAPVADPELEGWRNAVQAIVSNTQKAWGSEHETTINGHIVNSCVSSGIVAAGSDIATCQAAIASSDSSALSNFYNAFNAAIGS